MNGMDRAGRKKQIIRVVKEWDNRKRGATMNMGMIGHRIGLRPSSHLRGILDEMVKSGDLCEVSTEPNRHGQTFRAWRLQRWEQMPLPERYILINGVSVKVQ